MKVQEVLKENFEDFSLGAFNTEASCIITAYKEVT